MKNNIRPSVWIAFIAVLVFLTFLGLNRRGNTEVSPKSELVAHQSFGNDQGDDVSLSAVVQNTPANKESETPALENDGYLVATVKVDVDFSTNLTFVAPTNGMTQVNQTNKQ